MQFLCEYLNTVSIGGMGCEARGAGKILPRAVNWPRPALAFVFAAPHEVEQA